VAPMPDAEDGSDRDGMGEYQAAAGQAALMLVESLMLALVERGVIPSAELVESLMLVLVERAVIPASELIEVVETVIETKRRLAAEGREPEIAGQAAAMLTTIANSLAAASPQGRD
jgi:hypothetical protein